MRTRAIQAVIATSRAINTVDKQLLRLWWVLLSAEDRRDAGEIGGDLELIR